MPRVSKFLNRSWDDKTNDIAEKMGMKVEGKEVESIGGLHVIGTERHDSRRIDLQLRGRAGRQGDSGSSRFFLAMDDPLLRMFGGENDAGHDDSFGA